LTLLSYFLDKVLVYLNGKFILKSEAFISVMDRGFLFGDGVYEVFPVYNGLILGLESHLKRLQEGLDAINIVNPYDKKGWISIINKLISYHQENNKQAIYLQISRGCDDDRKHTYGKLKPTVFMQSSPFKSPTKSDLLKGSNAITRNDIRWSQCDTKATSLLANIMFAQEAKNHGVEEVILIRNGIVTECSSSNLFLVKNNCIYTHPKGSYILPGITRDMIIDCAKYCEIEVKEVSFNKDSLMAADEVWISSSTREVIPITHIDNSPINNSKVGETWSLIYDRYQAIKSINA
jgi:D-alanine transaminase